MKQKQQKKPEYFFEGPFRFVRPYEHTYQTHCKKRWLGQQLFPILCKEFLAYDEKYFLEAIKSGRIRINDKPVEPTYTLKNGDKLTHNTLREQPPILNLPVKIIHEDDDIIVVEKPASLIVHTGGGYHYNTLIKIMEYEMGYKELFIVHRLDRMTSGILILAKKKEKASQFHQDNAIEEVKKMYYARVGGQILWKQLKLEKPLICLSHKQGIWGVYQSELQKKQKKQQPQQYQPQQPQDKNKQVPKKQEEKPAKKMTNHRQDPNLAKESTTFFKKVWYDQKTDSTLLQCYPVTGRTHQIRVHLQYLGHPILNDTGYGGRFVGNKVIEVFGLLKQKPKEEQKVEANEKQQKGMKKPQNYSGEEEDNSEKQKIRKKVKLNSGYDAQVKFPIDRWDYRQKPWEIYLHSLRYNFEGKQYECTKPYWSKL